jgi:hypothetical protein
VQRADKRKGCNHNHTAWCNQSCLEETSSAFEIMQRSRSRGGIKDAISAVASTPDHNGVLILSERHAVRKINAYITPGSRKCSGLSHLEPAAVAFVFTEKMRRCSCLTQRVSVYNGCDLVRSFSRRKSCWQKGFVAMKLTLSSCQHFLLSKLVMHICERKQ